MFTGFDELWIQFAFIAAVAVVICMYASHRHAATVIVLCVLAGIAFGTAIGFVSAITFRYWGAPASFFGEYRFQVIGSSGAVLGWLSLESVAYLRRR